MILIILLALAVLYIYMICPRIINRPDISKLKNIHYAHRGLHDNKESYPENSIAAFLEAAARGYAIENDIHLIADGNVVVFHDYTLRRMCGEDVELEKCTLEQLKKYTLGNSAEKIPKEKGD